MDSLAALLLGQGLLPPPPPPQGALPHDTGHISTPSTGAFAPLRLRPAPRAPPPAVGACLLAWACSRVGCGCALASAPPAPCAPPPATAVVACLLAWACSRVGCGCALASAPPRW
jgi:hypothetical protein